MLSSRNSHCAFCGRKFNVGETFDVAPIIELDTPIRWVAVCTGLHAAPSRSKERSIGNVD